MGRGLFTQFAPSFFGFMTHSTLRRLNQRFAEAFGRPNGFSPKYKWCRTSDLKAFLKDGETTQQTQGGIYVVLPKYKRKTWADMLGDAYVIARWQAPGMTAEQWLAAHGTDIPYPANGRYLPIENTVLPKGVDPSEDLTQYAIGIIREQLEKTFAVHLAEGKEQARKDEEAASREWRDRLDDLWPAFDGVPGMKLHTSFPTPQKQITQPQR